MRRPTAWPWYSRPLERITRPSLGTRSPTSPSSRCAAEETPATTGGGRAERSRSKRVSQRTQSNERHVPVGSSEPRRKCCKRRNANCCHGARDGAGREARTTTGAAGSAWSAGATRTSLTCMIRRPRTSRCQSTAMQTVRTKTWKSRRAKSWRTTWARRRTAARCRCSTGPIGCSRPARQSLKRRPGRLPRRWSLRTLGTSVKAVDWQGIRITTTRKTRTALTTRPRDRSTGGKSCAGRAAVARPRTTINPTTTRRTCRSASTSRSRKRSDAPSAATRDAPSAGGTR